eukprot:jgi/Bigna1/130226/aug1.10_g4934
MTIIATVLVSNDLDDDEVLRQQLHLPVPGAFLAMPSDHEWLETKTKANAAFRARNFKEACQKYGEAIEFLKASQRETNKRDKKNNKKGARKRKKSVSKKDEGGDEYKKQMAILHTNRSQGHLMLKDYIKALKDAEKCVKLNPSNEKGWLRGAVALSKLERNKESMTWIEHILSDKLETSEKCTAQAQTLLRQLQTSMFSSEIKAAKTNEGKAATIVKMLNAWLSDNAAKPGDPVCLVPAGWWKTFVQGKDPG